MLLQSEHLCFYLALMSLLAEFEKDCDAAGVPPSAALKAGGVHPSLWGKWKGGKASPTLKNFEAARAGLKRLADPRAA